ncbi:MAG: glycosyltransferase family 9 protein [Deltaproteobacteria bacterium]|nr:glycosyltransferase family 9 protein [Deltaproteobacteria bacterium]
MLSTQGRKVNRKELPRALVLFPGSVGDFLCVLPAIAVISGAVPGGEVEVVARGEALELARHIPFVQRVFSLESGLFAQLFSAPGEGSADASSFFSSVTEIFSWYGHAHPEVTANLNRVAPERVRSFAFFSGQEDCHACAYYLRCVGMQELRCPSVALGEEERRWLDGYWDRHAWRSASRVLVIHPGSGGQKKRWAPDGFAQVAPWWQKRKGGKVLILLGPAEAQEAEQWRQVSEVEHSLALRQVAALLSRADLYLGNDSGVSHLAGAVGARGVVLFGPTRPQQWRPLGGSLSVIQNVRYRAALPHVPGISLAEVPPEEVFAGLIRHGG